MSSLSEQVKAIVKKETKSGSIATSFATAEELAEHISAYGYDIIDVDTNRGLGTFGVRFKARGRFMYINQWGWVSSA